MYCPNCSKELPDGTKFCGGCGTAIHVTEATETFAHSETPAYEAPVVSTYEAPVAAPIKPAEKKSVDVKGMVTKVKNTVVDTFKKIPFDKIPSKYLKIGAAALAVILVIVLVTSLFGGEKAPNYGLYLKDDEVYVTTLNGKAGNMITKKGLEDYEITQDGKKLFFLDGNGKLLYTKTSSKKEAVELDSKVSDYWVSENGKIVIYEKNGDLYKHNLKKEEKIAKDVRVQGVSPDCKIIYYRNDDGDLICWKNGKEEEIDDDVFIVHFSEDYKSIVYTDGEDLFTKKIGKKAKEIATDIEGASGITNDGTFYFWTYPDGDMSDYFDDNDLSGDMNFLSTLYYFNGTKAKKIADNVYVDTELSTSNAYGDRTVIYYYQFGKVAEGDLDYDDLMDLMDDDDMTYEQAMIELLTEVSGKCNRYIGINGKAGKVKLEEDIEQLYLSGNGKTMYALVDVEDGEGTLMKASVSGNKVKSFKEADTDVSARYIEGFVYTYADFGLSEIPEANCSNLFVYFKDVEGGEGELFINGKSAADDVSTNGVRYNPGKKAVMFYLDMKDGEGTLCMHNGKKLTEIAEDVYSYTIHRSGDVAFKSDYKDGEYTLSLYTGKVKVVAEDVAQFVFTADGDILYLTEMKKGEGDLYLYTGKAKMIDEDVTYILPVYSCPGA